MLPQINLSVLNPSSFISGAISAIFGSSDTVKDWRVRLSIPNIDGFKDSPVLKPLRDVGGLVFPYTPTIQVSHTANYDDINVTHQNYQFVAYESSRADTITVSGPFNVEDGQQALYWIAALHFLRSATKMFTGSDARDAGNPPPILKFNAYGEYVFNNVPVVIKSFSIDLPADADYIPADASVLGGLLGSLGAVGSVVGNLLISPTTSRVPTKSTLTVTLQPIYSREAARQFSLKQFVKGDYVKTGGYV